MLCLRCIIPSALILLAHLPLFLSQSRSILPSDPSSSFPACALDCPDLNGASDSCTESNVGATEEVLNSCFCQQERVVPFYESADGVCDTSCASEEERSTLQQWFQNYCASAGFDGGEGETATTLVTSTRSPTSTATGASSAGSRSSSSQDNGWFASHWQWVLMVILLFLGLGGLAILARFLKRRHERKVERRQMATPDAHIGSSASVGRDMWGPHQHMAHTRGWEYTSEQDRTMKEASATAGRGILGGAIGKARSLKRDGTRRLGKASRHASQRDAGSAPADAGTMRGVDEPTMEATAAIRKIRSSGKRDRKGGREGDGDPDTSKERKKPCLENESRPQTPEKSTFTG